MLNQPPKAVGDVNHPAPTRRRDIGFCLVLIALTLAVYGQLARHEFIMFDDAPYVTSNEYVQEGLTQRAFIWAFTTGWQANWHPLTWLSHALDCQLFGNWSGGHHLTNLLLHLFNVLLLYLLLRSMTAAPWRSAMVAGLFALHPLHVESVAWVAQRKDVLSSLFGLLALTAYFHYVTASRPTQARWRYSLVLLFFTLGLLSKPMVVTLPFLMLLLDYWPLERIALAGKRKKRAASFWPSVWPLVREKIPLFLLSAISCVITFYVQRAGGAMVSTERFTFLGRVGTALTAYQGYLQKMIVPLSLAPYYPNSFELERWPAFFAGVLLVFLTVTLLRAGRRRPYLAVGWLWFLGMLVPVIGLVQVGGQSMADRYTYLPLVGLFIALVWGAADLGVKRRWGARPLWALGLFILLVCGALTAKQVSYWSNPVTLFEHTLEVTGANPTVFNSLGCALSARGRNEEAERYFRDAIRLMPSYLEPYGNLAGVLFDRGQFEEAVQEYGVLLRLNPNDAQVHRSRGLAWFAWGKLIEAEADLREALGRNPGSALIHFDLARVLQDGGKTEEAIFHYREAVGLRPRHAEALNNLAWIMAVHPDGQFRNGQEAVRLAERAGSLSVVKDVNQLDTLAAAYAEVGRFADAVRVEREALFLAKESSAKNQENGIADLKARLALFESGSAYRENKPGITGGGRRGP